MPQQKPDPDCWRCKGEGGRIIRQGDHKLWEPCLCTLYPREHWPENSDMTIY